MSPQWRFTAPMILDAPDHRGVYVLWREGAPLAVGHALGGADTIRSRLLSHLAHQRAGSVKGITHYSWQICGEPLKRKTELARELGAA